MENRRKFLFQIITTLASLSSHDLPLQSPQLDINWATTTASSHWESVDIDYTLWLESVQRRVETQQSLHPVLEPPAATSKLGSTIVVDLHGNGQCSSVQEAIDLVPKHNTNRVVIQINAGVYKEKVLIPRSKPYITLQGQGRENTVIVWDDDAKEAQSTYKSATVAVNSIGFIAKYITFRNSYPAQRPGAMKEQAVAFRISGDEAAFYGCGFEAHQDTLYDHKGRHYFEDCYIEGSIDFIFGNGQSLYKRCELHVVPITPGSLTAQKRFQPGQNTGFCFILCKITGIGDVYLGRAWGPYSRVVFLRTYMANIITPQGWNDWGDSRRQQTVFYGEYNCSGPGASQQGRVKWVHELTYAQAQPFLAFDGLGFIDGQQWLST